LDAGGELRLAVTGRSMRPILREGDYLVVRPFRGPPRVGEVVVYARGGQIWAHRLLARSPSGNFLLTKGDARGRPDAPLSPGDLIGRAVAVERAGRLLGLGGLASRLAGLALNLSAPAAALGRRLAGKAGIVGGGRKHRIPAAGFVLEVSAPAEILRLLPRTPRGTPRRADFTMVLETREAPTTGGRYGLTDAGRGRYTLASPSVLARIDTLHSRSRAALLPGQEFDGLMNLLRVISILMVTEKGEGLALHASAARVGRRAYVFAGPGGTGKTTALTRAVEAGADPLADDLVLLRKVAGQWLVWAPPLERNLARRGYAPAEGAEVAALLIPARGKSLLELEPLTPARWATLAGVFPPGAPLYEKLLDRLGDLAESAPAYRAVYADRPGALDRLPGMLEERR
jgi:hypothetical protein